MSVLSLLPDDRRKDQRNSLTSVYSSNSRLNLLNKRKRMNPLGVDMSQHSLGKGDKFVTQRVLSAKTHRVKQLQNQLADAHYHLQELSNENRILRALQKKQEIALQRYENSNAELPQVLNSHNEEVRIQQSKYKQLKAQYKEATQKLKDRDMQLLQLRDEHQHLLDLSKDKNLLEREKLQYQVSELAAKVQQQSDTINLLQRRVALEAKNFRHQLQAEVNKHKDTRHDLDLAINNADKLSTIIEMKEKMLSTAASRNGKSPTKVPSVTNLARPLSKGIREGVGYRSADDRTNMDQSILSKLCENSRNISSALSHEEDTSSSSEPRSRFNISRSSTSRTTPSQTRKSSKGSDDIIELAKTVQDGMADLAIIDNDIGYKNASPNEMQKRMEAMKADLMSKIKSHEDPSTSRKSSALRRKSTEESIEEQIMEEVEVERPKSRGRRNSTVSFYESTTNIDVVVNGHGAGDEGEKTLAKRENSTLEKRNQRPLEKYCKEIIQDIEKSSKVIDVHMKQFSQSRHAGDQLVQRLQAVDRLNDFVNGADDAPDEALTELNDTFRTLAEQAPVAAPPPRTRAVSGRRTRGASTILGDAQLTNQELLEDLLGNK